MVTIRSFSEASGKKVSAIDIKNSRGMSVTVLDLGATIQSIFVPDRNSRAVDVCLGYDTAGEYLENGGYVGACIGRCANRIGGSRFELNGKEYILDANEGRNQLHGGANGFDRKMWAVAMLDNGAEFTCHAGDMESGYPGNIETRVRFTLDENNALTLEYFARCDADTVANFTNHCYFNLNGHDSGDVLHHRVTINADKYTPADKESIPTGELAEVSGTKLDFRQGRYIGDGVDAPEFVTFGGYDHNFVLNGAGFREAAWAYCPETGIGMKVSTTLEGLQFYTGNYITPRRGKGGASYGPRGGFCMETQHFPDAINKAGFPSPVLKKGEELYEKTVYQFFVED